MKLSTLILSLLFIITLSSCSKEAVEETEALNVLTVSTVIAKSTADILLTEKLVEAINDYRISKNLNTVVLDVNAAQNLAMGHCSYMSTKDEASHDNFLSRSTELRKTGATAVKENVAYGYSNANSIVNAWINSDSHRVTLEGDFNHVGIGFLNSISNTKYCTALFYKK